MLRCSGATGDFTPDKNHLSAQFISAYWMVTFWAVTAPVETVRDPVTTVYDTTLLNGQSYPPCRVTLLPEWKSRTSC